MIKPGIEEIKEVLPICEEKIQEAHKNFERDEKFYELDFRKELEIPKNLAGQIGIVLPTGRDVTDACVDHLSLSNARVYVNRKNTSDIAKDEAEMMRKIGHGLLYMTNVNADISPWRVAGKHFVVYGLCIIRTLYDADLWPDKPLRIKGESDNDYAIRLDEWRDETHLSLPIDISAINPRNIIPDPSYGGRQFVYEKHEKLCLDVSKRWPNWSNPKNRQLKDRVEYVSYWDKKYRCVLVDGEPILKVKGGVLEHKYGFIPYCFIDSGLGNISFEGKPEMRYVGILRYINDLLISESRNYSIADLVFKRGAMPWYTVQGADANLVKELKQGIGDTTEIPEGVVLQERAPQIPAGQFAEHLERTTFAIEAHGAPRSLRGLPEQGVRSAVHQRSMIGEAMARYRYSEDAFKHGTAKVLINCARLIKNVIPGNPRLWARTPTDEFDVVIDKKLMKEPFNFYVEYAPVSEEDEYTRHDDLEKLTRAGLLTPKAAWKQMPNIDPEQMEIEVMAERIKNEPSFFAQAMQLANMGLARAVNARVGAETMMEGGVSPPMGAPMGEEGALIPSSPNRARPGSAEELMLGIKNRTPQTPQFPGQGQGGGG